MGGVWALFGRSWIEALDIEQEAKLRQKKLAQNKTDKSLSWVNVFAQLAR